MTWTSSWRSLSGGDALGEVAGDERRALPVQRAGERAAGDVLGDAVEQAGERDLLGSCRPVVGEDLVGLPAEEQGVHALRLLEHDVAGLLVAQRRLPSAVREAAVAVLVGPSRRLRHPVERHELGHDELAHGVFLFLMATHQFRPQRHAGFIADDDCPGGGRTDGPVRCRTASAVQQFCRRSSCPQFTPRRAALRGSAPSTPVGRSMSKRSASTTSRSAVADRETLEAWASHLDDLGIADSGIQETGGPLIVFRDPDNIQLEVLSPALAR